MEKVRIFLTFMTKISRNFLPKFNVNKNFHSNGICLTFAAASIKRTYISKLVRNQNVKSTRGED